MNIRIKKLSLTNFKGAKNLEIDFDSVTNVFGDNGTGKTTIKDAFRWLFFGKDSSDRKDFEIKPLDENNIPLRKVDCEVYAVMDIDGEAITTKRVFHEKWTKKRGSSESEFTGNETIYYWNDVPLSQSEYQKKISLLIDEYVFKLITDPLYFSQVINWKDRRNVLMNIAGNITDADVAYSNKSFEKLIGELGRKKTLDEYKKEIVSKKKNIRDVLDFIPTRIDEATRSKPEPLDFGEVENQISGKLIELDQVRETIIDVTKRQQLANDSARSLQQDIYDLQRKADNIKNDIKNQLIASDRELGSGLDETKASIVNANNDISRKKGLISQKRSELDGALANVERYSKERESLREKWNEVNSSELTFDQSQFCCPTCKRAYEQDDIDSSKEHMLTNFNNDKQRRIADINNQGHSAKKQHEYYESQKDALSSELAALEAELPQMEARLEDLKKELSEKHNLIVQPEPVEVRISKSLTDSEEYQQLLITIRDKDTLLSSGPKIEIDSELSEKERLLNRDIASLNSTLARKEQIVIIEKRITDLQEEEKKLSNELTQLEGIEYTIQQFNKAKIDMLEQRINNMFGFVKFKMFEQQINGGETECCEALINGVPFTDANTASKTQAGIDIINTLSKHYNVHAPIFLDNRESVVLIPQTKSQIINLFVVKGAELSVGEVKYKEQKKELFPAA